MIVIGYNYKGLPISIVKAKSKELAMAYWHGAGIIPHSTKTEEDFDIENNGTGVIPILKTQSMDFKYNSPSTMLSTDTYLKVIE